MASDIHSLTRCSCSTSHSVRATPRPDRYPTAGGEMTDRARSAWQGIEVRHLAALQALAEEASFQRAARRLGYSQPAVSQQLATLERIVGAQLVNRPRVSHPLTLTEAGQRSARTREGDPGESRDRRSGARRRRRSGQAPHRRLPDDCCAPPAARAEGVRSRDAADRGRSHRYPRRRAARHLLEEGDLDLAFVDLPLRLHRELETESLAIDEYVLVMPHNSPLRVARRSGAHGRSGRAQADRLQASPAVRSASSRTCAARAIEPQFALRSDDNTVVQGFLAAGFGAALIPRLAADLLGGQFAVLRFESALPPRVIGLAWIRELAACPSAALFLATTRSVIARLWSDRVIAGESLQERRTA